MTIGNELELYI